MTSSLPKAISMAIQKGFNPSTFSPTTASQHSVFFYQGLDHRRLTHQQQLQIAKFVEQKPDSDSFMVYNSFEAKRKLKDWFKLLPWVRPFYAIKANPIPILCKQLSESGAGMDCASKTEIKQALDIGIPPSDIVFSNSIKNQNDLRWAYKNNIRLTTADSVDQLLKIQKLAPSMNILWRIAIKEDQHDRQFWGFSGKFGDDIQSPESIHARMKEIKDMGIRLHGIHFHSGSSRNGSLGFKKGILLARKCIQIGRQYNHRMEILDTGGGFPSGNITQNILQAFELTRNDPLGYRTIAEPGRHLSDNVFYLLTRIIGKRKKSNVQCYHLNQSIYHTFNCVLVQKTSFAGGNQYYGKVEKGSAPPLGQLQESTLFGMTCDGSDIISSQVITPKEMKVGDWLCFGGIGSYSNGMKSNFNGMISTEVVDYWSADVESQAEQKQIRSPA